MFSAPVLIGKGYCSPVFSTHILNASIFIWTQPSISPKELVELANFKKVIMSSSVNMLLKRPFFGDSQTRLRTKHDLEPSYISRLSFLQHRRVARAHFCYTDSTVRICSNGCLVRTQEPDEINLYGF